MSFIEIFSFEITSSAQSYVLRTEQSLKGKPFFKNVRNLIILNKEKIIRVSFENNIRVIQT